MLDENLPTFYLRSSSDGVKHNASILLSQHGDEASPAYSVRHPDPALPASRNRYAVALYDSYNPDVLFGEVLLIPEWSQPSPTKEEIRLNGGVPPPPQPILPSEYTIQLYNPDQQIHVKWHAGTWHSAPFWGFEMPQESFRQPSNSVLDRTQDDPTASENTPKLNFRWKKDGKLSKDYVCTLSDKSTNTEGNKRKNKEPDITTAIFKNWKEITIYEPNLTRIEIEDPKGFEVVLILGAIVIREVFNCNIREAFNITDTAQVSTNPGASNLAPQQPPRKHRHSVSGLLSSSTQNVSPPPNSNQQSIPSRPPPTDPRTQWELDAEAARLRKQVENEERERRRADEAETRRVKKMLEEEDRRAKERQKEIDRETERLRKIYGKEEKKSLQQLQNKPPLPNRHSHQPASSSSAQAVTAYPPAPMSRPHSAAPTQAPYFASNLRPQYQHEEPYLSPNFAGGGLPPSFPQASYNAPASSASSGQAAPSRRPFWQKSGSKDNNRLTKQRSTVF